MFNFLKKKTEILKEYKAEVSPLIKSVLLAFEEIGCDNPSEALIQACLKELEYEKTITPKAVRTAASNALYPTL